MGAYGNDRYGGAAYGGSSYGRGDIAGSGVTFTGYQASFYWATSGSGTAIGGSAIGGAQALAPPAAGLFASPDPDSGTVTIPLFWAFAQYVTLTRVDADGIRTPVRGSSPFQIVGNSRHNTASNPKSAIDLTGVQAGTNTTLTRLTGLTTPSSVVTTGFRGKATAAGAANITINTDAVGTLPTVYQFWAQCSAAPTAINMSVAWYDTNGLSLGTTTYAADPIAASQSFGQWSWCTIMVGSYPAGAASGVVSYQATGLPAAGTFDMTGRLTQQLSTPTDSYHKNYFDGDYQGAAWLGAVGASYSDKGDVNYATDGEAPLDVPFTYEMTNPTVPGYVARSTPITLDSGGRRSWLTHPASPLTPRPVYILGPFGPLVRSIEQGVFYPLDSDDGLPIVVTTSARRARTGTVQIFAESHEERDRLLGMFADGAPVLIRPPASYGEGDSLWLSLGELTETNRHPQQDTPYRVLSAPFYEVAPPVA